MQRDHLFSVSFTMSYDHCSIIDQQVLGHKFRPIECMSYHVYGYTNTAYHTHTHGVSNLL